MSLWFEQAVSQRVGTRRLNPVHMVFSVQRRIVYVHGLIIKKFLTFVFFRSAETENNMFLEIPAFSFQQFQKVLLS